MMKKGKRIRFIFLVAGILAVSSCSTTRFINSGELRLTRNVVSVDDRTFNTSELTPYIRQKAPAVFDRSQVASSRSNMLNHLEYIGYYGSAIEAREEHLSRGRVHVIYEVRLGKRYPIRRIVFDLPDYGSFASDFKSVSSSITIKRGQYLNASALETESARSAQQMRNMGYFGLTKNQYSFEADTLTVPGEVILKYSVKDYNRSDSRQNASPLEKYSIRDISISHEDNIRLKPSVLEELNLLRPGEPYNEDRINTTYARFSSLELFNGVNIQMDKADSARVDCAIKLRHSRLNALKMNAQFSVSAINTDDKLFGFSPQFTYINKNLFNGGERLSLNAKWDNQSDWGEHEAGERRKYSNEIAASASISFPRMLGISNGLFQGSHIPRTDITISGNYQNRPEYQRTILSGSFGYSGQLTPELSFQLVPIQTNIVRILKLDPAFKAKAEHDPFLSNAYQDHFDTGAGLVIVYSTQKKSDQKSPYEHARLGLDLSGNALSLLNPLLEKDSNGSYLIWETPYSQYVRAELQYSRTFFFGKALGQSIAFRVLSGAGLPYGNSSVLPFEKAFYSGGASSMRGWQSRTLGPGLSKMNDYFVIPNQTGDVKLEANIEYRMKLFWKIEGAVFTDVGNVWSIYESAAAESRLSMANLPESIAADWGIGIRLNYYIIARLDMGLRVHDPARDAGDRWVNPGKWLRSPNYAFHLAVGYPF